MPELPEVETVRRSLEPLLVGQAIAGIEVGSFAGVLGSVDSEVARAMLRGRHITGVRRRGKYLLIDLDDGSGIEIHLRMTGQLEVVEHTAPPLRFEHLAIHLANGFDVRFADQRKFGRVIVRAGNPDFELKSKLGPEPLSNAFSTNYFRETLRRRQAAIKSVLLDQRAIAGIGNIYADESLFRSKIHPNRPAGTLIDHEIRSLHRAIRSVLRSAIENRGTTFLSYRDATGQMGENQSRLAVYGRGRRGEPCFRCGSPLAFLVIGQRTSHFCPSCQRFDDPGTTATTEIGD